MGFCPEPAPGYPAPPGHGGGAGGLRPPAALVVNHLPPLDGGRVYQVWLRRDGERISLDTFQTDESGRARLFFRLPPDFETYQEMGVTIEPAGGGAAPSGVRVLVGSLKESSD
ncbi:MAG: hypothetical protein C4315_12190 [Chloroflexota bacterium]